MRDFLEDFLERLIFASRWLLAPIYIVLCLSLLFSRAERNCWFGVCVGYLADHRFARCDCGKTQNPASAAAEAWLCARADGAAVCDRHKS